jgi:hypothetical protein
VSLFLSSGVDSDDRADEKGADWEISSELKAVLEKAHALLAKRWQEETRVGPIYQTYC